MAMLVITRWYFKIAGVFMNFMSLPKQMGKSWVADFHI